MTIYTGTNGSLYFDGATSNTNPAAERLARVRGWTINVTADMLETTDLGDNDRTFVAGLRGATGTAQIFMHDDGTTATRPYQLLQRLLTQGNSSDTTRRPYQGKMTLDWEGSQGRMTFNCFINSFTLTMNTGEVMGADITFTVNGSFRDVQWT